MMACAAASRSFLKIKDALLNHAKICLLLLLTIPGMTIGKTGDPEDCNSITIQCVCGIGESKKFMPLKLKMVSINSPESGELKCSGYYPNPYQACANISCVFTQNNSISGVNAKDFIRNVYPKEFTILRGDVVQGRRFARHSDECRATPLKNAEVKCWKYPNSVTCSIKCVYGYGLRTRDGTLTSSIINCQHEENRWEPHGFYDCLPYLNCKVLLKNPGKVKCQENINRPTYCDITCAEYAQYDEVPLQRYQCDDESFGEDLPYCVSLSNHMRLIQTP